MGFTYVYCRVSLLNDYRDKENRIYIIAGYKLLALAIFIFLVFKFNSKQPENNGSLITGWWGILGLIGWGYLVSAFTYMACRDSIAKTLVVASFFLILNILSGLHQLEFLNPVKLLLGVIIEGNVPFTVLSAYSRTYHQEAACNRIQKSDAYLNRTRHFYRSRFLPEEMVHHFKNNGYAQLGNDMCRYQLPAVHADLLDSRCKEQDQMGRFCKTCRQAFPYNLSRS